MWLLPALLLITAIVLSIPLSAYFAWLMDGKYHAPRFLRRFEELVDTGPQDWKQYVLAMLAFTVGLGDPADAALTGGTADERGQTFLIAEISNSRVTLSLTRTPPPSSAAFQVTP